MTKTTVNPETEKEVNRQVEIIKQGSEEIIPEEQLKAKLRVSLERQVPLRIKAGFDPTAPDLHLGHTVLLQKLRDFQQLGHQVLFLIGDFTAKIGDPTGRNEARQVPTDEEIAENFRSYTTQVFKVLEKEKTTIVFNSEWFGKMSAADMLTLASRSTLSQILQREDFTKRHKSNAPIFLHEFLYPLVQGYDSVALQADIEVGGTDQKFNLLMGREMQKGYHQPEQIILTMPLLEGTDGEKKMSKSLGNYIGIAETPQEIFGKLMSLSDEMMMKYFLLLTDRRSGEINSMKEQIKTGALHPKSAKMLLAREIVSRYHSEAEAEEASRQFDALFRDKGVPDDMPEARVSLNDEKRLVNIVAENLKDSTSAIRRLVKQGGLQCNAEKVKDPNTVLTETGEYIIKAGKKRFLKIIVS